MLRAFVTCPQVFATVAFDYSMRILGPCLIVLALGLFAAVTYMFFYYLLPLALLAEVGGLWWCLHSAVAIFLLFNILFNYYYCVTTNPGNPSEDDPANRYVYNADANWGPGRFPDSSSVDPRSYGFCKKCRIPRPPRYVLISEADHE